jgi:hypothetical protein
LALATAPDFDSECGLVTWSGTASDPVTLRVRRRTPKFSPVQSLSIFVADFWIVADSFFAKSIFAGCASARFQGQAVCELQEIEIAVRGLPEVVLGVATVRS